ncbi:uncharacterized protein LOC122946546 [Bufo gargarizans]|uniref:uncharacterized protein LOC122946546 n=1 Tax=Bufo gargarizans TaxID=30331 RepID=UPI001CF5179B|nr:uncharacterized protein LOC122946546 [Bufo gargarizans]XP_044162192.1 uncharacterized protein LOC122946546 [Bufo gargarizans]
MDFRVVLALALVVTCGVEGCSVLPSPSLSLSLLSGRMTLNSLQCLLCLDRKAFSRHNHTFTLTKNGKVVKFSQVMGRKIWYPLDNKKNNTGLWGCNVQEFPDLRAEYYVGAPTPDPPGLKKADTEEASVPIASAMSTRILLTIMTAALLLIMLTIVICLTSGILIMKRRRTSAPHQHRQDRKRSDNFPLTENISSDPGHPKLEPDSEVSYVELEIIRDPFRKPSKSHNTIYANIM